MIYVYDEQARKNNPKDAQSQGLIGWKTCSNLRVSPILNFVDLRQAGQSMGLTDSRIRVQSMANDKE